MVPWTHISQPLNGISIGLPMCPTHRHTLRATSAAIDRICAMHTMRPTKNNIQVSVFKISFRSALLLILSCSNSFMIALILKLIRACMQSVSEKFTICNCARICIKSRPKFNKVKKMCSAADKAAPRTPVKLSILFRRSDWA